MPKELKIDGSVYVLKDKPKSPAAKEKALPTHLTIEAVAMMHDGLQIELKRLASMVLSLAQSVQAIEARCSQLDGFVRANQGEGNQALMGMLAAQGKRITALEEEGASLAARLLAVENKETPGIPLGDMPEGFAIPAEDFGKKEH